ncbi:hypothetical protein SSX86_006974 [Deinandra increscens subsp. villosa]|uniref:FBD domain-containing protein n=1 Tax=Deinandra increscens subsp. villosa TaxID=3103831 RepID=A0AAP0DH40_9ASTR
MLYKLAFCPKDGDTIGPWSPTLTLPVTSDHELESFTKLVDRVLKFSRASQLNLFRLNLNYVDLVPESTISSWFDEAVRRNVRELDIHVNLLELPISILTCKTLTKLRLVRNLYGQSFWECPCEHLKFKGSCKSGVISHFLECSPELKHLCIRKVRDVNFKDPGFPTSIEPRSVPACMLTNLTTIEFKEFEGEKCDIQLMKYILMNAQVLKKVTIIWGTFFKENIENQMKACAELLQVPRASKYCEMRFLGRTVYVDLRLVK